MAGLKGCVGKGRECWEGLRLVWELIECEGRWEDFDFFAACPESCGVTTLSGCCSASGKPSEALGFFLLLLARGRFVFLSVASPVEEDFFKRSVLSMAF